jgi:flagellar motility protein MotE (MotC chaperone)
MKGWLREVRLIPVVLIAVGSLFALKATGLWLDGGYSLGQRLTRGGGETITVTTVPASPATQLQAQTQPLDLAASRPTERRRSWAQEMFGYPGASEITGSVAGPAAAPRETLIVTGSAGPPKPKDPPKEPEKPAAKDAKDTKDAKAAPAKPDAPQTKPAAPADKPADLAARPATTVSAAERAVLERLLERRQELEAKAREIELRETLLKAAEKNLEAKLAALKANEAGPNGQRKSEAEAARFKSLVTMYETMKPKEAAKIFDRLDIKVLTEVASRINPRRMSEILAQMSAEAAERLTLEFAARGDADKKPAELPKIDGKPTGG